MPDGSALSAVLSCFLGRQVDGGGLLGTDDEVGLVLGFHDVVHGAEEAVGVGREVDAGGFGLEVEHGADEGGVLMREAVVFLTRPGRGLDVVDGGEVAAPGHFAGDLDELGVLHHHGVDDAEEGLVGGEESRAAGEGVPLHEALALVLRENLDDAAAVLHGVFVPLEVALRVVENSVELVGFELVGGEESEGLGVLLEQFVEELAGCLHAAFIDALLDTELLPVDRLQGRVWVICSLCLAEPLLCLGKDSSEGFDRLALIVQELANLVAGKPSIESLELLLISAGLGQRDLVGVEGSFNDLTLHLLGTSPALGGSENNHGPSRLHDRLVVLSRSLLDLLDLGHSPFQRALQVVINVLEVLHNTHLITVATEQARNLLVVHASKDGTLRDLEAVDMQNGDDGT